MKAVPYYGIHEKFALTSVYCVLIIFNHKDSLNFYKFFSSEFLCFVIINYITQLLKTESLKYDALYVKGHNLFRCLFSFHFLKYSKSIKFMLSRKKMMKCMSDEA